MQMAKMERDTLSKAQRECELRLKDLEVQRLKIDKEHVEAIERYKSDLQRNFADQDFEVHRRKLQVEEDEARVRNERDRIAMVQNANKEMMAELQKLKTEVHTLSKDNQELFKENRDMKDQLKTLNENLRRETEQLIARDRENNILREETSQLKKSMDQYREDTTGVKSEQARLIENLRLQLEETRARIVEMKDEKQHEFKKIKERYDDQRRREADQYTFELEKLRNESALSQKRLG